MGEVGELTITNAFASDTLELPITSGVYTTYSPGDGKCYVVLCSQLTNLTDTGADVDVLLKAEIAEKGSDSYTPASYYTVTVIGDGSTPIFGSGVESVVIPASVTEITENAFNGCTGLKSVTFAEDGQLTTIGDSTFYAANQLETLTIPEGVNSIGNHAFTATNKLQTITLPSTLTTVCGGAWFGNLFAFDSQNSAPANLMAVNIASGNEQYCSYDGVVYAADGKTLLYCPAAKQTIDWLAEVEEIAPYAFAKTTMEHIQLPDGLKAIQANGFRGAQ